MAANSIDDELHNVARHFGESCRAVFVEGNPEDRDETWQVVTDEQDENVKLAVAHHVIPLSKFDEEVAALKAKHGDKVQVLGDSYNLFPYYVGNKYFGAEGQIRQKQFVDKIYEKDNYLMFLAQDIKNAPDEETVLRLTMIAELTERLSEEDHKKLIVEESTAELEKRLAPMTEDDAKQAFAAFLISSNKETVKKREDLKDAFKRRDVDGLKP